MSSSIYPNYGIGKSLAPVTFIHFIMSCNIVFFSCILTLYNNSIDCETDSPRISFVKIAGSSPVHIPGNSMKTVMCTTRQKDKTGKYCAVVQALQGNQGSLPRNIMVVNSYAEINQGIVQVRMINIGLESLFVWLYTSLFS
jgi:hypothetical protein